DAYFDLKPFEKRLYEVVQAHCGGRSGEIGLDELHRLVDFHNDRRRFSYKLRRILTERQSELAGYRLEVIDPATGGPYRPRRGPQDGPPPQVSVTPVTGSFQKRGPGKY